MKPNKSIRGGKDSEVAVSRSFTGSSFIYISTAFDLVKTLSIPTQFCITIDTLIKRAIISLHSLISCIRFHCKTDIFTPRGFVLLCLFFFFLFISITISWRCGLLSAQFKLSAPWGSDYVHIFQAQNWCCINTKDMPLINKTSFQF